jgi:hypothetical protein
MHQSGQCAEESSAVQEYGPLGSGKIMRISQCLSMESEQNQYLAMKLLLKIFSGTQRKY